MAIARWIASIMIGMLGLHAPLRVEGESSYEAGRLKPMHFTGANHVTDQRVWMAGKPTLKKLSVILRYVHLLYVCGVAGMHGQLAAKLVAGEFK